MRDAGRGDAWRIRARALRHHEMLVNARGMWDFAEQ
jgi:hypothetical protein